MELKKKARRRHKRARRMHKKTYREWGDCYLLSLIYLEFEVWTLAELSSRLPSFAALCNRTRCLNRLWFTILSQETLEKVNSWCKQFKLKFVEFTCAPFRESNRLSPSVHQAHSLEWRVSPRRRLIIRKIMCKRTEFLECKDNLPERMLETLQPAT